MSLLEPDVRALADELIDGFPADGRVDLHDAYCVPLPSIVFLKLFGMPMEDMPALSGFKDGIIHCEAESLEERDAQGIAVGRELRALLRERLEERKASGRWFDDLLDQFLHFEIDGESLGDDDVLNIMHLFTIAGLDTVTSSMSCILSRFVLHPDERRRVMASPQLLPSAIEELMRFESPVFSGGVRWVSENTEVNCVPVRAGDLVYLCWATANVDPATFPDPLVIDLERTENRHIAFAAGLHRCLGSHLARNELRVAIDQLHRRVSDYWLQDGETIRYEQKSVRQAHRIPVEFTRAG
jgi:cytochrome P450